jgi:hypothetical protein
MPIPRLIHPIPVFLRKADREQTALMDDNLNEPVGQVRREQTPIKLMAQHGNVKDSAAMATEGGVNEKSDGYLLFLTADLNAARVTIERGDRVVQIGDGDVGREVDFYIVKLKYMGHYPRQRGPTLVRAYYEDRHPSRLRD